MKSFRKQFFSIFAISLVATLLLCPGNYSVPGGIRDNVCPVEVQAEEPTITDTQKGVALLMTILFAQGLRFVGDWNTIVEPGIEKLWNDFTTATGNAVTLPMIVAGSSLALGYIRTSNTVNNAIANFTAWYKNTFNQPTTGTSNVPVQSGGIAYYTLPYNGNNYYSVGRVEGNNTYKDIWFRKLNNNYEVRTCIIQNAGSMYYYLVSSTATLGYNGNFVLVKLDNSQASGSWSLNNSITVDGVTYRYFYYQMAGTSVNNRHNTHTYDSSIGNYNQQAVYFTYGAGASLPDIAMQGQSLELQDGYQLEQDQAKLYDISALTAMVGELALTLDNIEDLVRDIPLIYDTPWSLDYPDDPTYVDTPDDTIPWVTVPDSVIPAETPDYVPTTPGDTDSYKILGLERVFPFSIPFDLYYLTQIFVATPETPHFTFAIMNPATNQLLTQEFDLHWFDSLAAVIRTGETVAFLIFLIFVTRGLIRS